MEHRFLISDLQPNTQYEVRMNLKDTSYNEGWSGVYTFTTLPFIRTMSNVSGLTAVSLVDSINLTWRNPELDDLPGLKLIRSTISYPFDSNDVQVVFDGLAQSYVDNDVIAGQIYYYTLFTYDNFGNVSSGALTSAKIELIEEPIVEPEVPVVEPKEPVEVPIAVEPELPEVVIELPDEEIFVDLIPATPIDLADDIIIISPEEAKDRDDLMDRMREGSIKLFGLTKQYVGEKFDIFTENVGALSKQSIDELNDVKQGLVDQFGELQQDVYEGLTKYEKEEITRVIAEPLPPEFEASTVAKFSWVESDVKKTADYDADWHIFSNSQTLLSIPNDLFRKEVQTIIVSMEKQAYVLQYNEEVDGWESIMNAPEKKGKYQMIIQVIYTDNTYEELYRVVLVDPYGKVYVKKHIWSWQKPWQVFKAQYVSLSSAKVVLYTMDKTGEWVIWPAHLYDQYNPQLTSEDGGFAFLTPAGKYYLEVKKDGYQDYVGKAFEVENEVVNINIPMSEKGSIIIWLIMAGCVIIIALAFYRFSLKKEKL